MSKTFINEDYLLKFLRAECKDQMVHACEPIIQESMKLIEKKLREKVGSMVVGMIEQSIDVETNGSNLRITVLHKEARL